MGAGVLLKGCVTAIGTAVGIPYAVALLLRLLHGWPTSTEKLKHAFTPVQVIKVNLVFLRQMTWLRFTKAFLKSKYFYWTAPRTSLLIDVEYGLNGNCLDLYFPDRLPADEDRLLPCVLFVYGGGFGSGDKSMYGLVGHNVANAVNALVCCPNYSIYPKGHVDDMVQDIVDCIEWLQQNAAFYKADKDNILLLGHSAGAHLCVMAVFELLTKQSLQGPPLPTASIIESMRFEDTYFYDSNGDEDRTALGESTASASSFVVLDASRTEAQLKTETEPKPEPDTSFIVVRPDQASRSLADSSSSIELVRNDDDEESSDNGDASPPVAAPLSKKRKRRKPDLSRKLSKSQLEVYNLLSSIRGVIGVSGVYHIGDHYQFEIMQGVEDISAMARATYGPDCFDRFSPTVIAENLPAAVGLPPFILVHAVNDMTAPYTSTTRLAQTLGHQRLDLTVNLLPDGGHADLFLDLLDRDRLFHRLMMDIIVRTAERVLD